jgi:sterol desaturase/sphingolipid hydroxylase (fatty acid hydroxylase superfamily)
MSLRNAFKYAGYPVLVSWPLVVASLVLARYPLPANPLWSKVEEIGMFLFIAIPVVLTLIYLEKTMAAQPEHVVSPQDKRTDLVHLAMCWFAVNPVAQQLIGFATAIFAGTAAAKVGLGLWPTSAPLLVQLALAVIIGDFGHYWLHRVMHETGFGWRFHATHHGTPQVYWLNSTRFHAFEIIVNSFVQVGPLIVLGCTRECFLLYGMFTAVHGWVQHSNVAYRTGWLNLVMATPFNHRWHHSLVLAEANNNYGVITLIWDHVFRTYFSPRDRAFTAGVGIGDMPDFPKTYLTQFLSPFQWGQVPRVPVAAEAETAQVSKAA